MPINISLPEMLFMFLLYIYHKKIELNACKKIEKHVDVRSGNYSICLRDNINPFYTQFDTKEELDEWWAS